MLKGSEDPVRLRLVDLLGGLTAGIDCAQEIVQSSIRERVYPQGWKLYRRPFINHSLRFMPLTKA